MKKENKKFDWYWEIGDKKTNNPNEVIAWLIVEKAKLEEENKKLNEEIRFLEQCLDNKEKVNKKLREELSAYDREYFDEDKKAKNIYKSQKENILMGKIC